MSFDDNFIVRIATKQMEKYRQFVVSLRSYQLFRLVWSVET